MILSLTNTVEYQARRLYQQIGKKVDLDDLTSDAWVGAIDAVDRFDQTQATCPDNWERSLRTFATRRISGAMLDAMRERDHLSRTQRSGASKIYANAAAPRSLDEMKGGGKDVNDFDDIPIQDETAAKAFDQFEMSLALEQGMLILSDHHRDVLNMYYFDGLPLHVIGEKYGYTESRACQVLRDARSKLGVKLAAA